LSHKNNEFTIVYIRHIKQLKMNLKLVVTFLLHQM